MLQVDLENRVVEKVCLLPRSPRCPRCLCLRVLFPRVLFLQLLLSLAPLRPLQTGAEMQLVCPRKQQSHVHRKSFRSVEQLHRKNMVMGLLLPATATGVLEMRVAMDSL